MTLIFVNLPTLQPRLHWKTPSLISGLDHFLCLFTPPSSVPPKLKPNEEVKRRCPCTFCINYADRGSVFRLKTKLKITEFGSERSTPPSSTYLFRQFKHCIWEQGITLIVNLCNSEDEQKYQRYWPDEGSKIYGIFEVHLVSEHIWSTDYMVRSFYLKNTMTNETRTVTQFHFLSWSEDGVPANLKALLEFRRKVNKSYRGRSSPILVHSVKGTSRTGSYILVDLVINRITKGLGKLPGRS